MRLILLAVPLGTVKSDPQHHMLLRLLFIYFSFMLTLIEFFFCLMEFQFESPLTD